MEVEGIKDKRVKYWEKEKWVEKMSELKKERNKVMLRINMDDGNEGD